ncbi:MAG: methyl-accepting chemotaxis protein [Pyrinomonadaceae bacterium]
MLGNETTTRLAFKLAVPAMLAIMIASLIIGVLAYQANYSRLITEANKERQLKSAALLDNLATTRALMLDRVREAIRVYQNETYGKKPTLAPSVQLNDQRTVPNLMLDNVSLIKNDSFVYSIAERTGANIAVYVRDNSNQFVSVTTTTQKEDKSLAVGEALETSSQAANDLLQGKVNYNVAKIAGRPFVRGLQPIIDAGGRVIGAWSAAFPVTSFGDLSRKLAEEKILTTGFIALIDEKNKVVARSQTAPDAVLEDFINSTERESTHDGWSGTKQSVPDWNYTVISGYSNTDPQIGAELSSIFTWAITTAFLVTVLLGGIIVLISMRITSRLDETVDVAENLAEGDLSVDLKVTSNDEVGRLQRSMLKMLEYLRETAAQADQIAAGDLTVKVEPRSSRDRFGIANRNMLDNVLRLVQSQEERDQLQSSIMKLLEEVADVAEGDLTGQAEVTADATGAIADAFNYMIDELRTVVRRVKDAATQVGMSTGDIRATTEKLTNGSAAQAEQIAQTSSAVEEITASIREVSQSAAQSAQVATGALLTAQQGRQAVQNNVAAMARIRGQVQETAKRIKKLGERSQEIDEIVSIIDELADRTSILALNAALQAAAAGEQGRGFATVAEEVERLADRSTQATQRIAQLTRAIQLETKDVVASMEDTISEVVEGSQLANDAGNALQEIEEVSQNLATLIQNISQSARRQTLGSENIARSMTDISQITELVSNESKHTANSVKTLVSLTEKLRGSVATFKLPQAMDKTGKLPDIGINSSTFSVSALNGKEVTLN